MVGSCLDAVLYAFNNNYPIFFTRPIRPFRFDYLDADLDLAFLKAPSGPPKSLTTLDGERSVGLAKELLWERLLFLLSLDGKAPLSGLCHSMRYNGDSLVCSNEYSKIFELRFGECAYFSDANTAGLVAQKSLDEHMYLCYDYVAFNKGGKHEIDYILTDDDFVSEIWFFSSDRIDGNTPVRDACAVSKLTEPQLRDFDYSETMARFKVLKIMKDNGMRGKQNGYTEKGTPRHYDFRTSSIRREAHRIRNGLTAASPDIEIKTDSEESLLGLLQDAHNPHSAILNVLDVDSP